MSTEALFSPVVRSGTGALLSFSHWLQCFGATLARVRTPALHSPVFAEPSFGDLAAHLAEQSPVLRIRDEKGRSVAIDGDGGHRDLHGSVADQAGPGAGGAGACGFLAIHIAKAQGFALD